MTIAKRVRVVRKHFKLTYYDFSKQLNEKENKVKSVEYEKQRVPADFLVKIIHVFAVNPEWLLMGKGNMFTSENNEHAVLRRELLMNQRQARLNAFIDYLSQEKSEDDLVWLEGQLKRHVPDYLEFISTKQEKEELRKKQA